MVNALHVEVKLFLLDQLDFQLKNHKNTQNIGEC